MTKEYLKTLDKLDSDRAKALADALTPDDEKRINAQFDSVALGIEKRYGPYIGESKKSDRKVNDPKAYNEMMVTVRNIASDYDVPAESMAEISNYILNGKMSLDQASAFIADSFKGKKGTTGVDKGDEDIINAMRNNQGQPPGQPEQATPSQDEQLAKYQGLGDDELMSLVNQGDTAAIQVLRNRNLSRTKGRSLSLPGGTTEQERELGKQRLAEYNRLIAEGKPEEAKIALTSIPQTAPTSLAQAGQ